MMITILFSGDIVGKPGRTAVRELIPSLRKRYGVDCVITNAENAAGGSGLTPDVVAELLSSGVHAITSGDHIWKNRAVFEIIGREERLLRPANYPMDAPGRGGVVVTLPGGVKVGVVNLLGRVFMKPADCPFAAAVREIEIIRKETPVIIVDIHAEATSEKNAMGRFLDGKVTAVIGTHTHVQTADEQIFPGGTAYLSDAGMTGPTVSILGVEIKPVITNFLTQLPQRFEVAKERVEFQGVIVRADERTGKALGIERIRERMNPE
ncbi:MAG: TIGR00282 family metallophosphoesterase [Candidatus Aureabacteria bacterium]|nr:TIGR00282 family metallophosphoesterase [Candidatus Auribacterota bacterium]